MWAAYPRACADWTVTNMRFELQPDFDALFECLAIFYKLVNNLPDRLYTEEFCARHGIDRAQVKPLFAQIEQAEAQIAAVVPLSARAQRCFKKLEQGDGFAAMLLFSPPMPSVPEFIENVLQHNEAERVKWLAANILGYLRNELLPVETMREPTLQHLLKVIFEECSFDADKLLLCDICLHTDEYIKELGGVLSAALLAFTAAAPLLAERLKEITAYLQQQINQPGTDMASMTEGRVQSNNPETVLLYPSAMFSFVRTVYVLNSGREVLHFGMNVPPLKELASQGKASGADILQILGDKTKQDILRALREGKCYGQELANRLGLTTATISYHMNLLLQQRLVQAQRENARIYFLRDEPELAKALKRAEQYLGIDRGGTESH